MSAKNFIYSTLSTDVAYAVYSTGNSDLPILNKKILIKGGSNVANKHLITPQGVATVISDEELALLEKDEIFNLHRANGFIKVQKSQVEIEVVVADMESRDESAPIVPQDYVDNTGAKLSENSKGKMADPEVKTSKKKAKN